MFLHRIIPLGACGAKEVNFWPQEKVNLLGTLDEPECVLGVHLPQQAVFYQELVVLIDSLHVEVRHELHQRPLGVKRHMVLLCKDPGHLPYCHLLVHKERLGGSVTREYFDEELFHRCLFDLLNGNLDLLCFDLSLLLMLVRGV